MMINMFLNTRIVEGSTGKRDKAKKTRSEKDLSCEANLRALTSLRTYSREFVTNL